MKRKKRWGSGCGLGNINTRQVYEAEATCTPPKNNLFRLCVDSEDTYFLTLCCKGHSNNVSPGEDNYFFPTGQFKQNQLQDQNMVSDLKKN